MVSSLSASDPQRHSTQGVRKEQLTVDRTQRISSFGQNFVFLTCMIDYSIKVVPIGKNTNQPTTVSAGIVTR